MRPILSAGRSFWSWSCDEQAWSHLGSSAARGHGLSRVGPVEEDGLRFLLDRDAIAAELLRYGDANGDGWAEVIDTITMYPDARRQVVRLLAEIDAKEG